ncbi:MAG: hypothetical protein JJU18_09715 [Oceanicaulis sp.]|nr:hypothetical protein [Oceanicaulis sp.]
MKTDAASFFQDPAAYPPGAFNPNAYNLITYRRPKQENAILYFPDRPASGLNSLEELIQATGGSFLKGSDNERAFEKYAQEAARVDIKQAGARRGTVIPFLESVYPSAAIFNSGTGAWSSAQVSAALATVDRASVFRTLEGIPGQELAGIVIESPNALALAAHKMSAITDKVILASSLSPSCMAVQEAEISELLETPAHIYQAATAAAPGRRLVMMPFTGLNAGEREILCDGIIAGGKIVFCELSEKRRVDREPPYMDRRITTMTRIDRKVAAGVRDVAAQVLARLGVNNAVFHAEYSLTKSGALLTDLMTRPGGGFIPEMVAAKYGVDLRAAHVYASFGMESDLARLASNTMDNGAGIAIASCYARQEGECDRGAANGLVDALERDKRVIAFNVETVSSNVGIGLPDARACLALKSDAPDQALRELDQLVGEYGLD